MIEEISVKELQKILREGQDIQLLDVREKFEYDLVHLPNCLWIPLQEIPKRWAELDPDKRTIVYCHHGMRSFNAATFLHNQGFENIQNVSGGIDAYAREIDPQLARY